MPAIPRALVYGQLSINPISRTVKIDQDEIDLTAKEFDLLFTLAVHPGRIYNRESLLSAIWGYDAVDESRTIDVHVQRLRTKLRTPSGESWGIATVWGTGYRFDLHKQDEIRP